MPDERKVLRGGYNNFLSGQDSGRVPTLLADNQVALAINKTFRGGYADQRPPFLSRALVFADDEQETWVGSHRLQGWSREPFVLGNQSLIIFSSGGRIFRLEIDGYVVSEITPARPATTTTELTVPAIGESATVSVDDSDKILAGYPITLGGHRYLVTGKIGQSLTLTNLDDDSVTVASGATILFLDPNPQRPEQVWMYQADKYFIIQDNESPALIYDGGAIRRAGIGEVPVGSMGAFIRDRIWQVVGQSIAAGDILRGPTEVTSFMEETVLATKGRFWVSAADGEITAITTIATVNSYYPQGPVIVFTQNSGAIAINVPANRLLWREQNFPLVTLALIDHGATGQYSTGSSNSDIFYRATDGVHSFRLASEQNAAWGSVPDSREMTETFKGDTEELLQFTSAIVFDNRLLQTTNGVRSEVGVYHRGMAVLDFDLLSGIGQKARPVWDGLWTGIQVLGLLAGNFAKKKRAFAFVRSTAGAVEFWELLPTDNGAAQFDDTHNRIQSVIESRAFALFRRGDTTIDAQKLEAVELWLDKVSGVVEFTLMYRPEGSPCWYPWGATKTVCVKREDCAASEPGECKTFQDYRNGYRTRIGFGAPRDYSEPMEKRKTRDAYAHEIRLSQVGAARVRRIIVKASLVEEPSWKVDDGLCVSAIHPEITVPCSSSTATTDCRCGYVYNPDDGLWHKIAAFNQPDGVQVMYLETAGVP